MKYAGESFKSGGGALLCLLSVLLAGIVLRVYGLGGQNYWYDELITLKIAGEGLYTIVTGPRPPLYLVLAHFWIGMFGESEIATRLLSVIFGAASIAFMYLVAKSLYDRKTGVLTAFFMAASKFQIYYSQEIRYYALFELLTLVSFYFYLRFLRKSSYINAALYITSSILLYYSHDFGILIIAVQNLYLLVRFGILRKLYVKWFLSQLIIGLSVAPRLINTLGNKAMGESGPNWIPVPELLSPVLTFYDFMGVRPAVHNTAFDNAALIFFLAAAAAYALYKGPSVWMRTLRDSVSSKKGSPGVRSEIILVTLWFLFPILLIFILSRTVKPMYLNRYLICSAPALYILVSLLFMKLKNVIPLAVLLLTYAILVSPGLYGYYTRPVREDWREIGSYVRENDAAVSPVVIISYFSVNAFDYYNDGNYIFCALPEQRIDLNALFSLCGVDGFDNFWVVLKQSQLPGAYPPSFSYKNSRYRVVNEGEFVVSDDPPVTLFLFEKVSN